MLVSDDRGCAHRHGPDFNELDEIYDAGHRIAKALPKMAKAATGAADKFKGPLDHNLGRLTDR